MERPNMLFPLANIVFPDSDFRGSPGLFLHETEMSSGHGATSGIRLSFDTWMNLFAAKAWHRHCAMGDLYLRMELKGKGALTVSSHEASAAFGTVHGVLLYREFNLAECGEIVVRVPHAKDCEGVSLALEFADGRNAAIGRMCWCTDAAPLRESRMAIVICTFRRERYVRRTMEKFASFLDRFPSLQGRMQLLVVDNGRTLGEAHSPHIRILPNKNAGGAGGFCRGLMAANDGRFDRCLFMDDDVDIVPESFFRTLALADFLREEYQDASIHGPMMSLYHREEMVENLAACDGFMSFHACRGPMPVDRPGDVLRAIAVGGKASRGQWVHSAWWYSCFSLSLYKDEYPIPVFYRCDDIEWSWRKRGTPSVCMNGICVWHAPFIWRAGKSADHYYWPRNMLLLFMLHREGEKEQAIKKLRRRLDYLCGILDYVSVELLAAAVRDVLRGSAAFAEDPGEHLRRVQDICRKADVSPCRDFRALETAGQRTASPAGNDDEGTALDWYPPEEDFQGMRKVLVYNLSRATCETRVRDEEREAALRTEFQGLLSRLDEQYDAVAQDMRAGYERFRTRAFWDEYLGVGP